jgi:hypothetical protein
VTEDLEALSTEDLRHRAFRRAEKHLDVGFFWDLAKHLPVSDDLAADDSFSAPGKAVSDFIELFREFRGDNFGDNEPLLRAHFIEYLEKHGEN